MRNYSVFVALLLSGCAGAPTSASIKFSSSVVELRAIEPGKYGWLGNEWSIAKLKQALIAADANHPIGKILLFESDSELSLGQAIEIGFLAETIGAKAFLQSKGQFKAITVAK